MASLRRLLAVVAVPIALLTLASCSKDKAADTTAGTTADSTAASGTDSTVAPEAVRAPASEVTTGLRKIARISAEIGAAVPTDKSAAKNLVDSIEPVWSTIEGTIKANDADSYITFEDTFALLKTAANAGDATKAAKGSADTSAAVAAYLAKFPG